MEHLERAPQVEAADDRERPIDLGVLLDDRWLGQALQLADPLHALADAEIGDGRTSGRPSSKTSSISTVHRPMPRTVVSTSTISSSGARDTRARSRPASTRRARSRTKRPWRWRAPPHEGSLLPGGGAGPARPRPAGRPGPRADRRWWPRPGSRAAGPRLPARACGRGAQHRWAACRGPAGCTGWTARAGRARRRPARGDGANTAWSAVSSEPPSSASRVALLEEAARAERPHPVGADDAVARDDERDRVLGERGADRAGGADRLAHREGQRTVGGGGRRPPGWPGWPRRPRARTAAPRDRAGRR